MHALEDGPRILSTLGRLELLPGESKNLFVVLVVDGQSHSSLQGRLQQLEAKVCNISVHLWRDLVQLHCFNVVESFKIGVKG